MGNFLEMRRIRRLDAVSIAALLGWAAGCGNDPSEPVPNLPPDTFLTSSEPADSSRVPHHVSFNWNGQDADGTVPRTFDYILDSYARSVATIDQVHLVTPAVDDPRWTRVNAYELTLAVPADTLRADPRGDIGFGEFDRWHTFYLRAVDNEGAPDGSPEHRTFQAFTAAPKLWMLAPVVRGDAVTLPRTFVMNWDGNDPIGRDSPLQNPKEARWAIVPATLDAGGTPIGFPAALYDLPESSWSPWVSWTAADSAGREVIFRDKVPAGPGQQSFVFAVQGRDDGGAITPKFDATTLHANNYAAITLDGSLLVGPSIVVHAREESLSAWSFGGIGAPAQVALVDSDTLTLFWDAPNASRYGARGRDARYGWNIVDESDDLEWTSFSTVRIAAPHVLSAGGDVFKIQCRDNIGQTTTATISFQHAAAKPERVASGSGVTKRERARAAAAVRR
jgi:hypothetical protein